MKLSVEDRMNMPKLFPKRADIASQTLARDIGKKLVLTDAEKVDFGFEMKSEGEKVVSRWRAGLDPVEIPLSNAELDFLRGRVTDMDKAKDISRDILDLCLRVRDDQRDSGGAEAKPE